MKIEAMQARRGWPHRDGAHSSKRPAGKRRGGRMCFVPILAASLASSPVAALDLAFEPAAPPAHVMNRTVVLPWAKDVERLTAGRVKIRFPTWDIAPTDQMYDMVRRGFADGGYQEVRAHARYAPLPQIATLPLLHETAEASAVALWRTYESRFQDRSQYDGLHLLGFFSGPGSDVFSLKEPVTSIEALQRLRIASASAGSTMAMSWLGASATAIAPPRLHEALAGETFDVLTGVSLGDVVRLNIAPRIRSVTVIPGKVHTPAFAMFLNADVWRKLPERDKAAIGNVAGENLARRSRAWDRADEDFARTFPAGTVIVAAPPQFVDQLVRAWQPIHDEWIAVANRFGVDGKAALADYVAQVKAAAPGAKDAPPPTRRPDRRR